MSEEHQQAHEREFNAVMARFGIDVPAERCGGALHGFMELREFAELLRQPREVTSEPAAVFDLNVVLRGE